MGATRGNATAFCLTPPSESLGNKDSFSPELPPFYLVVCSRHLSSCTQGTPLHSQSSDCVSACPLGVGVLCTCLLGGLYHGQLPTEVTPPCFPASQPGKWFLADVVQYPSGRSLQPRSGGRNPHSLAVLAPISNEGMR